MKSEKAAADIRQACLAAIHAIAEEREMSGMGRFYSRKVENLLFTLWILAIAAELGSFLVVYVQVFSGASAGEPVSADLLAAQWGPFYQGLGWAYNLTLSAYLLFRWQRIDAEDAAVHGNPACAAAWRRYRGWKTVFRPVLVAEIVLSYCSLVTALAAPAVNAFLAGFPLGDWLSAAVLLTFIGCTFTRGRLFSAARLQGPQNAAHSP